MNHNSKFKRAAAIFLLVLICCIFISLILCLIRNSPPSVILAHLFCLMIIPCMFYAVRLFINALNKRIGRRSLTEEEPKQN